MSETFTMPGAGGEPGGANTYSIRFGGVVPRGMKGWHCAGRGSVTVENGRIVLTAAARSDRGGAVAVLAGLILGGMGGLLSLFLRRGEKVHCHANPALGHAAHDIIRQRWSLELTDGKWITFRLREPHMFDNERFASKLKELYGSRLSQTSLPRLTRMETAMILLSLAAIAWFVLAIVLWA